MHRFFVPPEWLSAEHAHLDGSVARQVSRVLRLSPGDQVTLLDGSGKEYLVRLRAFSGASVEGDVESVGEGRAEPHVHITLYQGLLKGEKLEWVLQKGVELGVSTFVPVICRRSVPLERRDWGPRTARWRRILTEAAEQCGRSRLPELRPPAAFRAACDEASTASGLAIIAWEREETVGLSWALSGTPSQRVGLIVGPEGGFEEDEVAYARGLGITPVGLGRRILRAETAGLAVVAAIQYHLGEMG